MAPWSSLMSWQPFNLDAAGFLTLVGADEINEAVGRLIPSRYLEFMPFLAAFVIAGNQFTKKAVGYHLYVIKDGIHITDAAGWFTRILSSNDGAVSSVHTYGILTVLTHPHQRTREILLSGSLATLVIGFLLVLAILTWDWYGFASSVGLLVSIFTRFYQVNAVKDAIDRSVLSYIRRSSISTQGGEFPPQRCLIITPEAKAITLEIPAKFDLRILSRNPVVEYQSYYVFVRCCGWAAFAVHIIALNMASTALKLYVSSVLILASILYILRLGCDDSPWDQIYQWGQTRCFHPQMYIGKYLKLELTTWPEAYEFYKDGRDNSIRIRGWNDDRTTQWRAERRQDLYAWLQLTPEEEAMFREWHLLPFQQGSSNWHYWWSDYIEKRDCVRDFTHGVRDSTAFSKWQRMYRNVVIY